MQTNKQKGKKHIQWKRRSEETFTKEDKNKKTKNNDMVVKQTI